MAPQFVFPSGLRDLEGSGNDDGANLCAASPVDVATLSAGELDELVKGVAFDLSDRDVTCIEDQDVFDRVYSLVRDFPLLSPSLKLHFVETLRSNLAVLLPSVDALSRSSADVDTVASYRNALKIYSFFLLTVTLAEETAGEAPDVPKATLASRRKKNPAYTWNWEAQRCRILSLIANTLEANLSLLFGSSDIDENYLSFISKCAFVLYESQHLLKDEESRTGLGRILGCVATKHQRSSQTCASILHMLHKHDFTVLHIAEAVASSASRYGDGCLAITLIREIGRADPKEYARDGVGAENVGRFLVELTDRSPKLVATNIGILIPHFGGESYKIRNALVSILGKLVVKAFKDIDGDQSAQSLRLRNKQAMLEILIERCKDVSAYTRSRVLQVWAELCEENALSIGHWNQVALVASERLKDKSAMVRKSALHLLITMLQHNPFGPQLRMVAFKATLDKYKEKLIGFEPSGESENVNEDNDAVHKQAVDQVESVSDSCLPSSDEQNERDETVPEIGNSEQMRALVASLEAALQFSKCISSLLPTLVQLLASPSVTDVENTILLLMRCRQFQIDGSDECLLKMLPLVFSQDKSIYEAVENAFISIYITKSPTETAQNLLKLAVSSSIGDLTALEALVCSLTSRGEISSSTVSALWDYFCFNINGVGAVQCRGALSVLCMAAKSSPSILSAHLQDIVDIGFGRWAKEEPLLARTACVAIEKLSEEDKDKLRNTNTKIFSALQSLITGFSLPANFWYAAADKAISAIYAIHPKPEILAADIVKRSLSSLFSGTMSGNLSDGISNNNAAFLDSISPAKLGRFLFVASHVALHQLVYIESCVKKIQKQNRKKENTASVTSEAEQTDQPKEKEVHGINAELGLGATIDAAIESLAVKAEKEIISCDSINRNLLGSYACFLAELCRNLKVLNKNPELQASAMLALCRLMIIDADYCESNLQLLFTVVENSPSEIVRSNCTIAIGDLAVRFPNLLEPWTEHVYMRLRDPSVRVRKNAVLVISHLILNDMMKVKGYINEMASRIEDEDERISSLAKLFFNELSKKGTNPIYNLLPDILGRLCSQNPSEDSFCNIMQFLIGSIKKDKQMDSLAEKLCNRFTGVNDVKQWQCIAYCLSQLTLTEKGLKKLIESFKLYEHVLSEDSVMNHFKLMIGKCKKFAKPEQKATMEEFEEKLRKVHEEKKEQDATARNAQVHHQKVGSLDNIIVQKKDMHKPIGDCAQDEIGAAIDSLDQQADNSSAAVQDSTSELSGTECSPESSTVTAEDNIGVVLEQEVQSSNASRKGTTRATRNSSSNTRRIGKSLRSS